MRIDCSVAGRYIIINYSEIAPSAGVRVREGEKFPSFFDYHFESFQELHELVHHILEIGTHEGYNNETK